MRLPVANDIGTRDGTMEKDPMLQNALVDVENGVPMARKRPGILGAYTSASGVGQGLFVWNVNGAPVLGAVVGDTNYQGVSGDFTPATRRLKFVASTVIDWKIATNVSPAVQVQALTPSGAVNTSFSGLVTLSLVGENTQGAVLSGNTATASSGVATFSSLQISKVGRFKLKATATDIKSDTSASFRVVSSMAFVNQPAPSYPGGPIDTISAKVVDSAGSTVTGFTGNLTISLADIDGYAASDQPTLSGTRTVAAVAGVAQWTGLSIDKPGQWTFRVTDYAVNPGVNGIPDSTAPFPPKWVTYPGSFANGSAGNLPVLTYGTVQTGWEFAFTTLP